MSLPRVTIFTDGACSGNPGPGGWGAILRFGDVEKELDAVFDHSDENYVGGGMQLKVIESLIN